jgi:exopolysaccharide biosynthesis WecB/TagA/CpsF family protein
VFKALLSIANRKKKRIFLYGAKKDVMAEVVKKISNEYSNAQVVGYSDGFSKLLQNALPIEMVSPRILKAHEEIKLAQIMESYAWNHLDAKENHRR